MSNSFYQLRDNLGWPLQIDINNNIIECREDQINEPFYHNTSLKPSELRLKAEKQLDKKCKWVLVEIKQVEEETWKRSILILPEEEDDLKL
jgi:hypothetical protein